MDGVCGTTCDRCGPSVRATTTYTRDGKSLDWCDHDAHAFGRALTDKGWVRRELALPDLRTMVTGPIASG